MLLKQNIMLNGFSDVAAEKASEASSRCEKEKLKRILFANKSSDGFYYYPSFLHFGSIFVMG